MSEDGFTVEIVGGSELQGFFENMKGIQNTPEAKQALTDAAMIVEEKVKKKLQEKVYDMSESWYKRTKGAGLYGATQATGEVSVTADTIKSTVASKKKYAPWVHFGTGIHAVDGKGRKGPWVFKDEYGKFHKTVGQKPKPYMTEGLQDAKEDVMEVLKDIIF
jgi:hypothetical protein